MPRCAEPGCGRWRPSPRLALSFLSRRRLNGEWYCSERCVESAALTSLDAPPAPARSATSLPPTRIGVLLRTLGAVREEQVQEALALQKNTGLTLGAQLRALGYVDRDVLLRALASQAAVAYLRSFDLRRVCGGSPLPIATVRALGLVPFEFDAATERIHVLCAAPVPRVALRALARLTEWTPVPYLVHDEVWAEALEAYEPLPEARHEAVAVSDLNAAAAHVAHATAQGDVTMRHVEYDRYIWVRVEAPQRVSDVLVTPHMMEAPCPAVHTAL